MWQVQQKQYAEYAEYAEIPKQKHPSKTLQVVD